MNTTHITSGLIVNVFLIGFMYHIHQFTMNRANMNLAFYSSFFISIQFGNTLMMPVVLCYSFITIIFGIISVFMNKTQKSNYISEQLDIKYDNRHSKYIMWAYHIWCHLILPLVSICIVMSQNLNNLNIDQILGGMFGAMAVCGTILNLEEQCNLSWGIELSSWFGGLSLANYFFNPELVDSSNTFKFLCNSFNQLNSFKLSQ